MNYVLVRDLDSFNASDVTLIIQFHVYWFEKRKQLQCICFKYYMFLTGMVFRGISSVPI